MTRIPRALLIDDEEIVRRSFARLLRQRDYEVVVASGGSEGLDVLFEDSDFDVIICDLMMPDVDGPMLFESLLDIDDALQERVVFCTGGCFTVRNRKFVAQVRRTNHVLTMPVPTETFVDIVDNVAGRVQP